MPKIETNTMDDRPEVAAHRATSAVWSPIVLRPGSAPDLPHRTGPPLRPMRPPAMQTSRSAGAMTDSLRGATQL